MSISRNLRGQFSGRVFGLGVNAAAAVVLAAGLAWAPAPTAEARQVQIANVQSYYAVVTTDDAMLRSGPGRAYYGVMGLERGQILQVDGESGEWKRVSYPAGGAALVTVDQVTLAAGGKSATLKDQGHLKALNAAFGLRGSWKPLLDTPLPAGTQLTVLGELKGDDGRVAGYRVQVPAAARAFVLDQVVRRATEEEIRAFVAVHGGQVPAETPATAAAQPAPAQPAPSEPATSTAAAPTPAQPVSLSDPMVPPQSQPAPAPVTIDQSRTGTNTVPPATPATPAPSEAAGDLGHGDHSTPEQPAAAAPTAPAERPMPRPADLEAAFRSIQNVPTEQAELGELISEFERVIATLDDSPGNRRLKSGLQSRLEVLNIRRDLQDQLRAASANREAASADASFVAQRIADAQRARAYTIVGRLAASTIYDGEQMPLMFRVMSVGGLGPSRTLGYVKPEPGLNLESKIGQVVGVVGEAAMDRSLRLNIITPRAVDVLGALPSAPPPSQPPAAMPTTGG